MNEKNIKDNILSNFSLFVRAGDSHQHLDMAIFAALCDRFLFDEICQILAQSPTCGFIYSGYSNKIRYSLHFHPKQDS